MSTKNFRAGDYTFSLRVNRPKKPGEPHGIVRLPAGAKFDGNRDALLRHANRAAGTQDVVTVEEEGTALHFSARVNISKLEEVAKTVHFFVYRGS